jgi:apolipoprotein N-acyltransferase
LVPVPVFLALLSGLLWAACFGERELRVAPWLALVPFLLLIARLPEHGAGWAAFRLGFAHGFASWLLGVWWIAPTLDTYGQLGVALGVGGLVLLAAYLGLFHAAFAVLAARARSASWAWTALGWAALWTALEALRGWLVTGFPWNLAAYAWVGMPGALPLSAWVGAWGVGFLLVAANGGLALALARRRWEIAAIAVAAPLVLRAVSARWASPDDLDRGAARPVRLVQPNIANLVSWDAAAVEAGYQRLLRLSRDACDQAGALIVWPESAAWPLAWADDQRLRDDVAALNAAGCSVLLNSVRSEGGRDFNSAVLAAPAQPPRFADKRHLVPFGEYVPLKTLLPFADKLARNVGDFSPSSELVLLPWGAERLGVAICFEVIFPREVAATTRAGATLLATITNDAWYGPTSAPWQHFRAARFRAAENRRFLLRAAITGVSAVVGPDGSVWEQIGVFEDGVIRRRVIGTKGLTPYARLPWLVPLLCTLAALGALIPGWAGHFRRRRSRE